MATTQSNDVAALEKEVEQTVQKPHWSIRLYVTEYSEDDSVSESWSHIPVHLSWWSRMCLRLAGFRIKKRTPRENVQGRTYRIRGAGKSDGE